MKLAIDEAKFWSRIDILGADDCWLWRAGRTSAGYGAFAVRSKGSTQQVLAHRVALALATSGMRSAFALHSCDTPTCCNPRHLRWGSQRDNVADAVSRGRHRAPPRNDGHSHWTKRGAPRGERAPSSKMTDKDISEIYRLRLSGQSSIAIAKRFSLDKSTILDVINGRYWGHLLGVNGNPILDDLKAVEHNKTPGAKITPDIAREIKQALAGGETGRSIARRFGIHFASVSDIKRGLTWRDA